MTRPSHQRFIDDAAPRRRPAMPSDDLFANVPGINHAALDRWMQQAQADFFASRTDENFKRLCHARQQVYADLIRTNPRKPKGRTAAQGGQADGK